MIDITRCRRAAILILSCHYAITPDCRFAATRAAAARGALRQRLCRAARCAAADAPLL